MNTVTLMCTKCMLHFKSSSWNHRAALQTSCLWTGAGWLTGTWPHFYSHFAQGTWGLASRVAFPRQTFCHLLVSAFHLNSLGVLKALPQILVYPHSSSLVNNTGMTQPGPGVPENQTLASTQSWPLLPSRASSPPASCPSALRTTVHSQGVHTSMLPWFPLSRASHPVPSPHPKPCWGSGGDQHTWHALSGVPRKVLPTPSCLGQLVQLLVFWPFPGLRNEPCDSVSYLSQIEKGMSNPGSYIPLLPLLPPKCCCTPHHTLSSAPSSSWESYWSSERGWPSETCLLGQPLERQKWHGSSCWEMQVLFLFFMLSTETFSYTICKFIMLTGPQLLWLFQKETLVSTFLGWRSWTPLCTWFTKTHGEEGQATW